MLRKRALVAGLIASTLSLVGCAAPMTPLTPPPTEPQPGGAQLQPTQPGPTQPAVVPAQPVVTELAGLVTFRGEPVAGSAVKVFDAQTGAPIEVRTELDGATGLALLSQDSVTDAAGRFKLRVANLTPGKAIRIVAAKGQGALETLVTGTGAMIGAPASARRVLASDPVLLTELTTAVAKLARGVVMNTQVLRSESAAPVIDKAIAELSALAGKLDETLKRDPSMANRLVETKDISTVSAAEADQLRSLVRSANLLQETTRSVAALISEIAAQATDAAKAAPVSEAVKSDLARMELLGTVLISTFNGKLGLVNELTGGAIDAANVDLAHSVVKTINKSSGSGSGSSTPTTPEIEVQTYTVTLDARAKGFGGLWHDGKVTAAPYDVGTSDAFVELEEEDLSQPTYSAGLLRLSSEESVVLQAPAVTLKVGGNAVLNEDSEIKMAYDASGNGGDLTLHVSGILRISENAVIDLSGRPGTLASQGGNGGNLTIYAGGYMVDNNAELRVGGGADLGAGAGMPGTIKLYGPVAEELENDLLVEAFPTTADLTTGSKTSDSGAYDVAGADDVTLRYVGFDAVTTKPAGTNVAFKFSESADKETWSTWTSDITTLTKRYVRFQATFSSTDATKVPSLDGLTLKYQVMP